MMFTGARIHPHDVVDSAPPPSRGSQSSGETTQEATASKVRTAMRKVEVRCPWGTKEEHTQLRARAPELSFQGHRSKSGK